MSGSVLHFAAWVGIICGIFLCFAMVFIGIGWLFVFPLIGVLEIWLGMGFGYMIIRCGTFFSDRGLSLIGKAKAMEDVLLLTHANTSDLPVSESLVRASSEPIEEQHNILLRASVQSQHIPAEQLLRPVEE